ncbi:MAG TPA: acetylglutamate kinase [Acidimicrobiales bacterium]|nr:acetylglutamate kinase [Acidimicrobiales bacterium]
MSGTLTPAAKAAVLAEALPYIRRFWGKKVVVKYGGNALAGSDGTDPLASFAADIVLMSSVGMQPVVVHGGGPQIGDLMGRLGMEPVFRDGLRVTDEATLDVARMVLVGKVNREIVAAINTHGALALGLSGEDGRLLMAKQRDPALGFVGDITAVNTGVLCGLLDQELIPVIATIGVDDEGQAYNINADTAAAAIAEALEAEKLVYLTDIEGIRRDVDDPESRISTLTPVQAEELIADGTVSEGMIPKVRSCVEAVQAGVGVAHILDGRVPRALLLEIFTEEGIGTMVTETSPNVMVTETSPNGMATEAGK